MINLEQIFYICRFELCVVLRINFITIRNFSMKDVCPDFTYLLSWRLRMSEGFVRKDVKRKISESI